MFKNNDIFQLFIVCPPGLEGVLTAELKTLGIKKMQPELGGVSLKSDFKMLMRLNLYLRSASRILLRLSSFRALHLDQLERPFNKLPFELFFPKGSMISLHITSSHSRLYHSGALWDKIAAIMTKLGYEITNNNDQQSNEPLLFVRVNENIVEISINSSGEHLYRRGYKEEIGPAPLRENLAAALLLHLGYHGQCALWDPCAGAGTIPIEAALIAAHIPPGFKRSFAFCAWPIFNKDLFAAELARAEKFIKKPTFTIFASDISNKSANMIKHNSQRANIYSALNIWDEAIENIENIPLNRGGIIVVNPPYGERIHGVNGLKKLYESLGQIANNHVNIAMYLLVPSEDLLRLTKSRYQPAGISFKHGGIPVSLYKLIK